MTEFILTVIGCGSALPMHGRHPSAQVIRYGDVYTLVDCGEGTQERLKKSGVRPFKIRQILISHLHGDHVFGLPGILGSFSHLHRTEPLTIYGPVGLRGYLEETIKYTALKISYPLTIWEEAPKGPTKICSHADLDIYTFPLDHRIHCNGYIFRENTLEMHLKKDQISELELLPEQLQQLKRGEDIIYQGRMIPNHVLAEIRDEPVSYAYCSDTRFSRTIVPWIKNVSVLYHETTFRNDKVDMAEQTGHSTAGEAGRIAKEAEVSCLITGHYSSRYKDVQPLLDEAGEYFPYVIASEEGRQYNLRQLARGMPA